MKTILLPTDFSESARKAIEYGLKMFSGEKNQYILLNTVELSSASGNAGMIVNMNEILAKDSLDGLKKELELAKKMEGADDQFFETTQMFGEFLSCVRKIVKDKKIDMVVMGTTGASGMKEFFVGSNAAEVMQGLEVPVLSVPYQADYKPIKKVLFANDLRRLGNIKSLERIKKIIDEQEAELILFNVKKTKSKLSPEERERSKELLLDYFKGRKVSFDTVENDNTVEGINTYLSEHSDIDLLAMVPHRMNFFEKIFKSSTTKKVAYHSSIPLLTVRDGQS